MQRHVAQLAATFLLLAAHLRGQESVCELFRDLKASDGKQLIVTGDLIISKNVAALGAADCDHQYRSRIGNSGIRVFQIWPTALHLRPSARVPAKQIQLFQEAAAEADHLRHLGKLIAASASFSGRLRIVPVDDFPAELTFDSIESLEVEALPDPSDLPVIPICELFQNLPAWKGKRIAVRAESSSTMEGSWIGGSCKGSFYTNGYRWPVVLDYAGPAYYSSRIAAIAEVKRPSGRPKGWESLRGRYNVIETATYVGRLRMRSEYMAVCRGSGDYLTNGFGHLNGAAGELIVEAVRDVELTHRPLTELDDADEEPSCQPANRTELCAGAKTLSLAASMGCVDQARELLTKEGIDSKAGEESSVLDSAIRFGHETIVKLLLDAGASVNPTEFRLWPPLAEAAHAGKVRIMKLLLQAGANVDGRDNDGETYLAGYAVFNTRVARTLLEAGADPNAIDGRGQTALMQASGYGYEDAVKLLIEHRADVNLKDKSGRSALMHAAAGSYVDAIPYLLANGADVHARDLQGNTALDIARKSKNEVAVELLSAATKSR